MNFEGAERIAAAILYEGYILYPYRPSAIKNRQRWNFGTLYPRAYAEAQRPAEPLGFVSEFLIVADEKATLDLRLSFLQLLRGEQQSSVFEEVELHAPTDPSLEWDEATERTSEHAELRVKDLVASPLKLSLHVGDARDLEGLLTLRAEVLDEGAYKIHMELANTSCLPSGAAAKRDEALPLSFVSAHALLRLSSGEFVSLLDPAEKYRAAVAACCNTGVFPVLAGEEGDRSMLLCSPIILYDHPKIAPESAGDFFDGTEMDEMLTLRVLTLTDAEKQEMREGDSHARRILERTEALTPEAMLQAHGVTREVREPQDPREPQSIREEIR